MDLSELSQSNKHSPIKRYLDQIMPSLKINNSNWKILDQIAVLNGSDPRELQPIGGSDWIETDLVDHSP